MLLDKLAERRNTELLDIYGELAAPDVDDIRGEFAGRFPSDREPALQSFFRGIRGRWLGMAFAPMDTESVHGEGYNCWSHDGIQCRSDRFLWQLGVSEFDGEPCLRLRYAPFANISGAIHMVAELRQMDEGLFLGHYSARVAYPPFLRHQQGQRSSYEAFLLGGPIGPWAGTDDPTAETRNLGLAVIRSLTQPVAVRRALGLLFSGLGPKE